MGRRLQYEPIIGCGLNDQGASRKISRGLPGQLHVSFRSRPQIGMGKVQKEASVGSIPAGQALLRRADFELSTPWEEPRSEVELKLAEMWRQVLRMDAVGTADDFIDLGGDSLAATTLAAEIESNFDVRFAPGDIIELSTIAKQARALESNTPSRVPPYIIVSRTEGSKPPLFMVHGAVGFIFFKNEFLEEVGHDRPIYLFQAPGMDGRTQTFKTVQEIARAYIASMREIQPLGPYNISAMCAGSFIALEMCNQLADAGQTVAHLVLLDPPATPPALHAKYPKQQLGFAREILEGVYAALRRIITSSPAPGSFEHEQKKRASRLKSRQQILQKRRRSVGDEYATPPEERSYSPEVMLETSMLLHDAIKTYVPRPYARKAALLLTSKHAHQTIDYKKSFWRDYLGGMDCQVYDVGHRALFQKPQIAEVARFVRNVLESPS